MFSWISHLFLGTILILSVRILARNKWHTQTRNLLNKSQRLSRIKVKPTRESSAFWGSNCWGVVIIQRSEVR